MKMQLPRKHVVYLLENKTIKILSLSATFKVNVL